MSSARVMQDTRRSRLRQGVLSWELLRDITDPGRYVEHFVDETWAEHLRRFDRMTAADVALRDRRLASSHRRIAATGLALRCRARRAIAMTGRRRACLQSAT